MSMEFWASPLAQTGTTFFLVVLTILCVFGTHTTGKLIGEPLIDHHGAVISVDFSPDGTRIVAETHDFNDLSLRLWDAETGQPIGNLLTGEEVSSVAFSPDGTRIVSGSYDGTLRLWDASKGRPIGKPLTGHEKAVRSVAFSPDGRRVVSGSDDNTLRVWPVFDDWADELCKKLGRNMSHKEWREWVSPDIDYIEQCPGLPIPPDEPEATTIATKTTQP